MTAAPKLRLRAPVVPEQDIHEAVAAALLRVVLPPAMWSFFPAGGGVPLPPRFGAKLNRMGLQRGWPDFLILHQTLYGLELKRQGGQLSKTRTVRTKSGGPRELLGQQDVFPKLERAGMTIAVCRSVDEVLHTLVAWRIPIRWHVVQP